MICGYLVVRPCQFVTVCCKKAKGMCAGRCLGHRSDRHSPTVIKPINVVCRNVSDLIDTESPGRVERRTSLIAKEL